MLALKEALLTNSSLHTLGLANAHLGEEGGVTLAEVIEGNRSLQRLDLRRNTLGIAGLMAIHISMKANSALLEVALDGIVADASDNDAEMQSHFMSDIKVRRLTSIERAPRAHAPATASLHPPRARLSARAPTSRPPAAPPTHARHASVCACRRRAHAMRRPPTPTSP